MTRPLTDVAARTAKPRAKAYRLAAGAGLSLEVAPTGARYWRLKYRFGGKQKRLALGVYPEVSVKRALELRDDARALLKSGTDPAMKRKLDKLARRSEQSDLFGAIATEWLDRQDVARITDAKNRWLLTTFATPHLSARPIREITAPEILAVLRAVECTGKLETAARLRVKLSQVWRYAIATARADRDPTVDLRGALKSPKVKHRASIVDPKRIGALLRAIHGYEGLAITAAALKLAPLVFVRPGELRAAEWSEFDLAARMWRIPAERMKMGAAHLVPLSRQAVEILSELQPLTGSSRFVFPSVRSWQRCMSDMTLNAALRRLGYGADEMTAHGFRSMASTRLNEQGWHRDAIERQLAHAERDNVRAAYNSAEHLPERKKMMQHWSDYLDGLRMGAEVVPLRKKSGGEV